MQIWLKEVLLRTYITESGHTHRSEGIICDNVSAVARRKRKRKLCDAQHLMFCFYPFLVGLSLSQGSCGMHHCCDALCLNNFTAAKISRNILSSKHHWQQEYMDIYMPIYICIYHWAGTATTNKPRGRHMRGGVCVSCSSSRGGHCTAGAKYGVIDTSAKNLKIKNLS